MQKKVLDFDSDGISGMSVNKFNPVQDIGK